MRPIEVRIWHKELREMFWLDLAWGNRYGSGDGWICAVPWGEDCTPAFYRGDNRVELDPDNCEFMLFTTLLDRNGKKIFESDLLQSGHREIVKCVWFDEGAGFVFQAINDPDWVWAPNEYSTANEWEVIGSIYENPELLK